MQFGDWSSDVCSSDLAVFGDILSPKTAPETIAPTTSAGFRPSVVPIPKNAIPDRKSVV